MRDSTNVQAPVEKKAIIAMSGGVDSSVAALLCQQQGFDCVGVTLALTDNSDRGLPEEAFPGERTCCSVDDVADARSVWPRSVTAPRQTPSSSKSALALPRTNSASCA